MKAIDAIRTAMQISDQGVTKLVEDMRDAPLTQPTPRGGNHPLWVIGHVAYVEANIPRVLFGEPNALEHWAPLFAPGTEPTTDASAYPPIDEVLGAYRQARARNLKILDEIGESGLDQPTKSPPRGLEGTLGTAGQTFLLIAMHHMHHRGQVADARRAAGRVAMFTPRM
jgi:uncharacterized damage-inducible protein DinB